MTRYAKRVDGNHADICGVLRAVPGIKLLDTSAMPGLGADVIAAYQGGPLHMLEIKNGAKKPLTDSERRARALFPGYWHRVETIADALAVFGIEAERAPF